MNLTFLSHTSNENKQQRNKLTHIWLRSSQPCQVLCISKQSNNRHKHKHVPNLQTLHGNKQHPIITVDLESHWLRHIFFSFERKQKMHIRHMQQQQLSGLPSGCARGLPTEIGKGVHLWFLLFLLAVFGAVVPAGERWWSYLIHCVYTLYSDDDYSICLWPAVICDMLGFLQSQFWYVGWWRLVHPMGDMDVVSCSIVAFCCSCLHWDDQVRTYNFERTSILSTALRL